MQSSVRAGAPPGNTAIESRRGDLQPAPASIASDTLTLPERLGHNLRHAGC